LSGSSFSYDKVSNIFWLFGGYGDDINANIDYLNDLWKFNGKNWTWISGSNQSNENAGIYGTQGVANSSNIPGARYSAVSWIDSNNIFWLFGGYGYDAVDNGNNLNDLWKFDGFNWTWISGSNLANDYGSLVAHSSQFNIPGARYGAATSISSNNLFWLFGGYGPSDYANDFWTLSVSSSTSSMTPTSSTKHTSSSTKHTPSSMTTTSSTKHSSSTLLTPSYLFLLFIMLYHALAY